MRILVVEDNEVLADGISKAFRFDGHGVDEVHSGNLAIDFLKQEIIDLVILDINLPDISGLEVLRCIRSERMDMPVLMLTARAEQSDKIKGLDAGADDYLTKPFDLDELKARARALLRRRSKEQVNIIQLGDIQFDANARQLKINEQGVELPRKELSLLELLLHRGEQVVSKQQILDHLYGAGSDIEESTVEIYIHRLRKRLAQTRTEIRTLRGMGYCLRLKP
ncbi:MAG: response regulator transcription factor [Gammaproteobacteria bacterium]|nr:response regulator transcription factor [Gammaproteobacteria bacterium]